MTAFDTLLPFVATILTSLVAHLHSTRWVLLVQSPQCDEVLVVKVEALQVILELLLLSVVEGFAMLFA